jgi:glycosyltransferase involved in cell wall biosynthesis
LYLGRVEEYKGVELMIRAVAKSKKKLKVAGTGSALEDMKRLVKELNAEDNIEFLGYVEDSLKGELIYNCKGLIFPVRDEDFGIVPVEANAAGCPVLAYKGGGVLETIVDGKTGLFFSEYTVESLSKALDEWDEYHFDAEDCLNQSQKFSFEVFQNNILNIVNEIR